MTAPPSRASPPPVPCQPPACPRGGPSTPHRACHRRSSPHAPSSAPQFAHGVAWATFALFTLGALVLLLMWMFMAGAPRRPRAVPAGVAPAPASVATRPAPRVAVEQRHAFVATFFVCTIASCAYFAKCTGMGEAQLFGRVVPLARYIDWVRRCSPPAPAAAAAPPAAASAGTSPPHGPSGGDHAADAVRALPHRRRRLVDDADGGGLRHPDDGGGHLLRVPRPLDAPPRDDGVVRAGAPDPPPPPPTPPHRHTTPAPGPTPPHLAMLPRAASST